MTNTPYMNWTIPAEYEEGWYGKFVALFGGVDASSFASAENVNSIIMGGGNLSFNAAADTISWSADIQINPATSRFFLYIASGSTTILDSQWLYFLVPRKMRQNTIGAFIAGTSVIPSTGRTVYDYLAFVRRRGNRLYFRNGLTLGDGETGPVFSFSPAAVAATNHTHIMEKFDLTGGETSVTLSHVAPQLIDIRFYRGGLIGASIDDYTLAPATGIVTFSPPGPIGVLDERIIIDKMIQV